MAKPKPKRSAAILPFDRPWAAPDVFSLKRMCAKGMSYGDMAKALVRTRNQVIGKARRLGYRGKENATFSIGSAMPISMSEFRKATVNGATMTALDMFHGVADVVSLESLSTSDCRWPIGDPRKPNFGFCGAPIAEGSCYCTQHHAIAYDPAEVGADAVEPVDPIALPKAA